MTTNFNILDFINANPGLTILDLFKKYIYEGTKVPDINVIISFIRRDLQLVCNFGEELFHLIANEQYEVAEFLIDKLVNVRYIEPKENMSNLHLAIFKNNATIFDLLLEKGINIDTYNVHNRTPLYYAIFLKNSYFASCLLKRKASFDNELILLAKENTPEVLLIIKERYIYDIKFNKADPVTYMAYFPDENPTEILGFYVKYNYANLDISKINLLVQIGADLTSDIDNYTRILDIAIINMNYELIKYILDNDSKIITVEITVDIDGILETYIIVNIERTFDINKPNKNSNTYLHTAYINNCRSDIIKLLIDNGADITAKNTYGKTASMYSRL